MSDPRAGNNDKVSPLQAEIISPTGKSNKAKKSDIKPMYEKEWDDVETQASDALDKSKEKKKEEGV